MKRFLAILLGVSVLLNIVLLLRGKENRPPAVPRPPLVQEKIVVVEKDVPAPAPQAPRPDPPRPIEPESTGLIRRDRPSVAPAGSVTLTALPASVPAGETIQVVWTAYSGKAAPTDWVGLYPAGAHAQAHQVWQYVGGGTQGTLTFQAPGAAGTYEFRYLLDNGYAVLATSNPVTVVGGTSLVQLAVYPSSTVAGSPLTVVWTVLLGKRTKTDWIGLYPAGTPNSNYVAWQYVGEGVQGTLTIAAPKEPGTYEVRFLPENGTASLAVSNPVTVVR